MAFAQKTASIPLEEGVSWELAQWRAMLSAKPTLRTHADRLADARCQKERTSAAESAFPRLIAEVERLQDESRGYWLDAALLEKENTALKAEVERLSKLVLDAADYIQPCKLEQSIFSRKEMAHMLRDLAATK